MDRDKILADLEELSRDFGAIAAHARARGEDFQSQIRKKIVGMCQEPERGEAIVSNAQEAIAACRSECPEHRLAGMIALEFCWKYELHALKEAVFNGLCTEHNTKVLLHAMKCAGRVYRCSDDSRVIEALQCVARNALFTSEISILAGHVIQLVSTGTANKGV